MAYTRASYGWAVKRDLLEVNPSRGISASGRESPRDRVLGLDEMSAIWRASEVLNLLLRLLVLTLQRREEVVRGDSWYTTTSCYADDSGALTSQVNRGAVP